jgi:hypothetical protein
MQPELRVYLMLNPLQQQFSSFLSSVVGGRGYVPIEGLNSLIVEIAPGLLIERVTDVALKAVPALEPGILIVERQFGVLELHSADPDELDQAGQEMLKWLNLEASDQLCPELLFSDVIENITDQHAVIINRQKQASMILPGESLLLVEIVPALFASFVANEAEKAFPDIKLVDVRMIGASGRIYIAGVPKVLHETLVYLKTILASIQGRKMNPEPSSKRRGSSQA